MRVLRTLVGELRSGDSYAFVLALLLASLVLGVVAPEGFWGVVRDGVFAATVVVAYWTATARHAFLVRRVLVPSIALVFVVLGAVGGGTTDAVAATIGAGLAAWMAFLIARDLVRRHHVGVQTVLGALSFYVLIGFFFASLFSLVGELEDSPLFTRGDDGETGERIYFSFVAITTTGFGDLAPAASVARALTVLEIVVGQLYLVTVVAVIVTAATRLIAGERSD